MSSHTKNTLKEARERIKNKDFQTALKLCKGILKEEKDNYMALVFLGVSLQEVGPSDQAPNAFRKAILSNATNLLAWNGLANYYEKLDSEDAKKELVDIYASLLEIDSNEKKLVEYCEKIVACAKGKECSKVVGCLKKIAIRDNLSEETRNSVWSLLAAFLSNLANLEETLRDVYEECLMILIRNSKTVTSSYYVDYLKILYKQNKYEQLFEKAQKMHALYENDTTCLEWMCKVYNELEIENAVLAIHFAETIATVCDTLLSANPESSMGLFTRSVILCKTNNLLDAKDDLVKVTAIRPGLLHAWVLLTKCFVGLGFYEDALESARRADKLLTSVGNSNSSLRNLLDELLPDVLSRTNDKSNWVEAITMSKNKITDNATSTLMPALIRSYTKLGYFDEAKKLLIQLTQCDSRHSDYVLLNACLLKKQGKLEAALAFLESENYNDDWEKCVEMGLLHWELGTYGKSLVSFLKATKLNPNSFVCFLNLGHYYQKFNDLDKARRCYEKAFKINGGSLSAGLELSKIYRKLKNWDANLALLQSLTKGKATNCNLWAWIQLGLSYLEQGDHNNAIDTLRYVIRIDPSNSSCWESLADAYMARGAYTSSLKSYQKAAELNPNSLYPQLQIAHIKQMLGQYPEARADFENILFNNKQYIPALKGLSETCMNQARQYRKSQMLGRARDCAEYAFDTVILALEQNSNLSCLWKLAGDSSFLVATLPERYCCMLVPKALVEGKNISGNVPLEQNDLYLLAARCYCKALGLIDDNVLIWHDLAKCYLSHAQNVKDAASLDFCNRALAAVQHCVALNPTHWQHWNLLGNIAYFQEPKNYALAQHAFIKAVTVEKNSAMSWCNLGALYLNLGDVKLANEAFAQAQRSDPNYVDSWVGQALVAERLGHEDAMDLFRHSTQLGPQQQGAAGYGYWVCKTLLEAPPHKVIYSIHNMHAVPVACDALTWYTENDPDDPCAWNMLGLLRERMGLKSGAAQAFRSALRLCSSSHRDQVNVNYGRSLVKLGKYSQAVEMYKDVRAATFNSGTGLALALFKDRQYEESYGAYESALHWLTDEQSCQSDLLVALASMACLFQGPEAAKTLLFQSTQLKSPSPWGLYATLCLGLLNNDLNLAQLVLKELDKLKDDLRCVSHYAILLSYMYILQHDSQKAVRELSKLVHRHPEQASLWLSLSSLLLRMYSKTPHTFAPARCAQIAMNLGQTNMDVTKVLCLESLALFLIGDYEKALKSAQQAVHYFPNVTECWAVFISAMAVKARKDENFARTAKLRETFDHVENIMKPSALISDWLKTQELF